MRHFALALGHVREELGLVLALSRAPGARALQAWSRTVGGTAARLGEPAGYIDLWWSADGSRVYGFVGGDDSVWRVLDVGARQAVAEICVRADAPPCP